jgi:hypothetical protein
MGVIWCGRVYIRFGELEKRGAIWYVYVYIGLGEPIYN